MTIQNVGPGAADGEVNAFDDEQMPTSFFTLGTKIAYFRVGGHFNIPMVRFGVHERLLDHHGFYKESVPRQDFHGDVVYDLGKDEPCAFQGLIELLYGRSLPTDNLIRVAKYPESWDARDDFDNFAEETPLTLSLAVEVFYLARRLSMHSIANKAMTLIFNYYKEHGKVPSTTRIRQIFAHERCEDELSVGLEDFIIDLCYKRETTDDRDDLESLPPRFLAAIYFRNTELNWFGADKNIVPLKLNMYHYRCESSTQHGPCVCEDVIE